MAKTKRILQKLELNVIALLLQPADRQKLKNAILAHQPRRVWIIYGVKI